MLNKKDKEGNAMLQLRQRPPRYLGEREREREFGMGQCHDASPKRMRMMIRQAELKEPRGEQKGKVESGIQRPATWVRMLAKRSGGKCVQHSR